MKKFFLIYLLPLFFTNAIFAQDMLSKIPASTNLVIKYAGGSLTKKMPAEKFESYLMLKKKFFNALKADGNTSLKNIGINLQQDAYQYLITTDTTTNFVTLVAINDVEKFSQFIKQKNDKKIPIQSKNGFQYYPISSNVFLGWNGKMASIVLSYYNSHNYYEPSLIVDTAKMYGSVGDMAPYADSSIALEKATTADSVREVVEAANVLMDTVKAMADISSVAIDSAINEPIIQDNSYTEATISAAETAEETAMEKANRELREQFYRDEEIRKDSVQKVIGESILQATFNTPVKSVKDDISFIKLIDNNADISIWMDSTGLLSKIPFFGTYSSKFSYNAIPGYTQGINIYFDADKVRIEQQLYFANSETARLFKSIYNSKQNPSFINYLHASDIGYLSVSLNSEALMNFYYGFAKTIFSNMPYLGKDASLIDAYVDIVEIIIDEKAIANVLPGNAVFILHGLKPRKVKYIDYNYDDNYNGKEVTKTKTEMSPDFSILFDTKNEKIFNKLINLPIKLNKDSAYNYKKTGDFYTLELGEKNIIEKLYFKVKEGKCIISTSLQDINGVVQNEKNAVSAAAKESVLNSNYFIDINFKNLITGISSNTTNKKDKKMISYLQANVKNMTLESTIKDDLVKTTTILNITGKHKNSVEYFFNVIENLLKIDAGDKK